MANKMTDREYELIKYIGLKIIVAGTAVLWVATGKFLDSFGISFLIMLLYFTLGRKEIKENLK